MPGWDFRCRNRRVCSGLSFSTVETSCHCEARSGEAISCLTSRGYARQAGDCCGAARLAMTGGLTKAACAIQQRSPPDGRRNRVVKAPARGQRARSRRASTAGNAAAIALRGTAARVPCRSNARPSSTSRANTARTGEASGAAIAASSDSPRRPAGPAAAGSVPAPPAPSRCAAFQPRHRRRRALAWPPAPAHPASGQRQPPARRPRPAHTRANRPASRSPVPPRSPARRSAYAGRRVATCRHRAPRASGVATA